MEKLLKLDQLLNFVKKRKDQDFVDVLHSRVMPVILMFAAAIIFAKEYGGSPIQCWPNAEWPEHWLEYAHDFCFIESTYYIPMENPIPGNNGLRRVRAISYYQWLPFILVGMAFFCMAPNIVWRVFSFMFGIQLHAVVEMSKKMRKQVCMNESSEQAWQIAQHINMALSSTVVVQRNPVLLCACVGKCYFAIVNSWRRNRLAVFYVIVKLLCICSAIGQFFFLGYFLGDNKAQIWGLRMTNAFLEKGEAWRETGLFPRVTLCDFTIRMPNNKFMNYTVQCVLPANMLNEKVFLTLFYVFVFLCLITVINVANWAFLLAFRCSRRRRINKCFARSVNQICPPPPPPFQDVTPIDDQSNPNDHVSRRRRAGSPDSEATTDSVNTNSTSDNSTTSENFAVSLNQIRKRFGGSIQQSANVIHVLSENADNAQSANSARKNGLNVRSNYLLNTCGKVMEGIALSREEKRVLCEFIRQTSWEKFNKKKKAGNAESRELTEYEKRYIALSVRLFFRELFEEMREQFLTFLGADGVLAIELMHTNSSEILASQILGKLFCEFSIEALVTE